jgi:hypothetical protein
MLYSVYTIFFCFVYSYIHTYTDISWLKNVGFCEFHLFLVKTKMMGLFLRQKVPYFSIDNARVIYTKKFWIHKKWTCAVYIRKVWEVNQM